MKAWTLDSRIEMEKASIAIITEAMISPTELSRYSQNGRLNVTP